VLEEQTDHLPKKIKNLKAEMEKMPVISILANRLISTLLKDLYLHNF
jgi:hypothetical protein